MPQKKLPSNNRYQNVVIPTEAKKGILISYCSNNKKYAIEYLVRFVDDEAIIGAKRQVNLGGSTGQTTAKSTPLEGKYKLINGVDFQCQCCASTTISRCSCGVWHCDFPSKSQKTHTTCPICGVKGNPVETDIISATSKPSVKIRPKNQKAISGSTVKRLTNS